MVTSLSGVGRSPLDSDILGASVFLLTCIYPDVRIYDHNLVTWGEKTLDYNNDAAFEELATLRAAALEKALKNKTFRDHYENELKDFDNSKNNGDNRLYIGNNKAEVFYGFIHKHSGPDEAYLAKRNEIADANDPLAKSELRKINQRKSGQYDKGDLLQEARWGLLHAIDMFDRGAKLQFSTYAPHWIRQRVIRYMESNVSALHVPAYYARECWSEGKKVPKANSLGESSVRNDDNEDGYDRLPDSRQVNRTNTELTEEQQAIRTGLEKLEFIEQRVLRLRWGLFGGTPMTLETAGLRLEMSKERVRQIEAGALAKLKALGPSVFGIGD